MVCGSIAEARDIYIVVNEKIKYSFSSFTIALDTYIKILLICKKNLFKVINHILQFFSYYIFGISNKGIYKCIFKFVKEIQDIVINS